MEDGETVSTMVTAWHDAVEATDHELNAIVKEAERAKAQVRRQSIMLRLP